jgi:hypothetical protein
LRLALQNAQNNDALTEVAAIKAMISHRSDSYTAWLDKLERELTAVEPEKK